MVRIRERLPLELGVSKVLRQYDRGPVLLFEETEKPPYRIVANVFSERKRLLEILGARSHEEAYEKLLEAERRPLEPVVRPMPEDLEEVGDKLDALPILKYYGRDAGPYITAGIVIARDVEEGFQNMSIHRLLKLGRDRMAIRIVPRHLYAMYEKARERGEDLRVAIVVGAHPVLYVAAASSPPYGVDEAHVAARIMGGLEVFESDLTGLAIPADAEIVIEGRILRDERAPEGPFVDVTGTYDIVRMEPVVVVDRVLAVEADPLYQAILPAGSEHRLLMGFYREAKIWKAARSVVPTVREVRLTEGGCGWLHCVISMRKKFEGDPKNVIMAAFAAHPSLKMVIVVDEDVDVDDPIQIEWALATRMQPDEDLVVVRNARGSSLDPSADQERLLTSKLGIDATIPLGKPRESFERAEIP